MIQKLRYWYDLLLLNFGCCRKGGMFLFYMGHQEKQPIRNIENKSQILEYLEDPNFSKGYVFNFKTKLAFAIYREEGKLLFTRLNFNEVALGIAQAIKKAREEM